MSATVSARTTRAALGIARAHGLDAASLAERHGVHTALADGDVDARFPHRAWLELWRAIVAHTGDDAVGLRAAEGLPFGHFDVIDYLIATSEDLGTALARFSRYFALVSTGVRHALEARGEETALVRRYAADCETRLLAPAEFAFANIILRTRFASGTAWRPKMIRFAAPPPRDIEARRRFFDCPVYFDAKTSAIVMDTGTLSLPMKTPDAALRGILERHAGLLSDALDTRPREDDLAVRTRRALIEGMRDADVSLASTARRLGMSARTFQRRLCDEGLSFDATLDDTRRTLARQYLRDPTLSTKETCQLLAFGHERGFYRAFRRWEGCTPAEYRSRDVARYARPSSS